MPNYVQNVLHFTADNMEAINKVKSFLKGEETLVDFNNIMKMPAEIRATEASSLVDQCIAYFYAVKFKDYSRLYCKTEEVEEKLSEILERRSDAYEVGEKYFNIKKKYGFKDWYEWAINNWGTKWNAIEPMEGPDTLFFKTAWSAVCNLIQNLSILFPKVKMEYSFADEDIGSNCARYVFLNGEVIDSYEPFDNYDEAEEFAANCWNFFDYEYYETEDEDSDEDDFDGKSFVYLEPD